MTEHIAANPGFYLVHYKHEWREREVPYIRTPIIGWDDYGGLLTIGGIGAEGVSRGDVLLVECPDGETFRFYGFAASKTPPQTECYGSRHEAAHALSQRPDDILDGF